MCTQSTLMPQSQRWSMRPTLDLNSDKSQLMLQSQTQTRQCSTTSKLQIGRGMAHSMMRTSICKASYIYPRDYVQEIWPAVLVREGNMQLVKYSLDILTRYSTYLLIFKSQIGSIIFSYHNSGKTFERENLYKFRNL